MSHPVVAALVYNLGHQEPWVELDVEVTHADGTCTTERVCSRIEDVRLLSVCRALQEASAQGVAYDAAGVHLTTPLNQTVNTRTQDQFPDVDWLAWSGKVSAIRMVGWYAPMLRNVVDSWLASAGQEGVEQPYVVLVSTETSDRSLQGSDTFPAAALFSDWLQRTRVSQLKDVRIIKRANDPFRIESVHSTMQALRDVIAELREKSRDRHGKPWFAVAWSASTGTGAITSSLHHAIAHLKPDVIHVTKAYGKFSREGQIELEKVAFQVIEQRPFEPIDDLPRDVQWLCNEMVEFRDEIAKYQAAAAATRASNGGLSEGDAQEADAHAPQSTPFQNEITDFWLRKSHKPVLAVLEIERPDGTREYVRGMNLEVSMPTGSLCAERNAIGTALAKMPGLMRKHIRRVAVLSADRKGDLNPLAPCGVCREWLLKIAEVQPDFEVVMFRDYECRKVQRKPVEE